MGPIGIPVLHAHAELDAIIRAIHESVILYICEVFNWSEDVKVEVLGHGCEMLATPTVDGVPIKGHSAVRYT